MVMPNEDGSAMERPLPAVSWATICRELPDLQRQAHKSGLSERFRTLKRAFGTDEAALAEWLSLRAELRAVEAHERGYSRDEKRPWAAAMDHIVARGFASDDPPKYVCRKGLCARQAQAVAGEAPPCDLFGGDMAPAGDETLDPQPPFAR